MTVPYDVQALFDAYIDGELSAAQWSQLETWIAADPDHAAVFMQWIALQGWTYEALRSQALEQVMRDGPLPTHRVDSATGVAAPPLTKAEDHAPPRFSKPWGPALALAATIFLVAWGTPILLRPPVDPLGRRVAPPVRSADRGDAGGPSIAATLMRLENCEWVDPRTALTYGQQLAAGDRVTLRSGIVRLAFESGAQVVLQGPCDFTVDSAMHGTIRHGRLSATVPHRAYGFRIRSPDAEIIDLGTQFGVAVDQGRSEVHVFEGEVLSRRVNAQGDQLGELFRIVANEALRFGASPEQPSHITSDAANFIRPRSNAESSSGHAALPVAADLALWLAADLGVKTEGDRRVVAWPDILSGDNVTSEDALQPKTTAQPKLASTAINGRPAVRFNGVSNYLVTLPLETTDSQTILMVCQFSERALRPGRKRGGQILNYNGPPHRLVSSTYEPGVLQIGEPIIGGFAPTRLGAKLFAGRLGGRDVSESEIYTSALGANKPVVLAYRYDLAAHEATLWCNGEMVDRKPALRPAGITSRKVIGRHGFMNFFFDGDLGELLIYNRALSADQLDEVAHYLGRKFNIPLASAADAEL